MNKEINITELSEHPDLFESAVQYFWKCWGSDTNFIFYKNCMEHSMDNKKSIPKFYIVLNEKEIIASYALITNDLISRQDLMPWFACLFVNEEHRNNGIAEQLLSHALQEARAKGFNQLYLSTDLINFYEKKGWSYLAQGYNFLGEEIKIYSKST